INFYFGFNHGAALRAFQAAETIDPDCAMNYWGAALACGGDINFPGVPPAMAELAWKQIQLARERAAHASPVEQDLIEALANRYVEHQPDDRASLDQAYADAMRIAWKKYPDDPDVGSLFAESMMDLRPWDQWTPDGKPEPGTEEILATLETVLKTRPQHPFANHLYVHALEASPHPERALAAADRLRDLQPGIAHAVHMPSHIYIRVGHWEDAVTANLNAVAADGRYRSVFGEPKGFLVLYAAHNHQMLAYAAMMTGQKQLAVQHIREMVRGVPEEDIKENATVVEPLCAEPYEVLIRFGLWDEILAQPDHPEFMVFTRAFRHAARGIAYAAKGDTKSARAEQSAFLEAAKLIPAENKLLNNSCDSVLKVVTPMLNGEILVREGDVEGGLAELRKAVGAEDALKYDEPPDWILPVRHSLGANLTQAGRYAEAEQVYRDDLARLPENGWSLFGLARCLQLRGKRNEASAVEARFQKVWANADMQITSSCLCQPGA
ncbi:MAG TPA: tetratricopeptide repeat protein, partial [Chthoniobacterales bacterium]|nr:tetratricopeptide repeat protein [Chthoniobacterales bacterium]